MTPVPEPALTHDLPGRDRDAVRRNIASRLLYSLGRDARTATARDWFHATALAARDQLMAQWLESSRPAAGRGKTVCYLSMEFLTGRLLGNSLLNLGLGDEFRGALAEMEVAFDEVGAIEQDAALGNGGLGRLAACLLDSMATLDIPAFGYGIRYEYGIFFQGIEGGAQVEHPDTWLRYGNPWEVARPEVLYPVRFGGRSDAYVDEAGRLRFDWADADAVFAMAYDTPVPGHGGRTVNTLRLWSAKATREFNLQHFNDGHYFRAVEEKTHSENLSKVLYPDDSTEAGRELRLKQQYFFVSASLQDILHRCLAAHGRLRDLPHRVAIQLNDTHPAIGIAELMRLLVDVHDFGWDEAWAITQRAFAYTNHTLMPEALETWPAALFGRLLPRHLQIIHEIDRRFLEEVAQRHPGDDERARRVAIVDRSGGERIRMAHLAAVGSHRVNGVAEIHSDLMRQSVFSGLAELRPGAFVNVTNGVTPRRWLLHANPALAALVTDCIGDAWVRDLQELGRLAGHAHRPEVLQRLLEIKQQNKVRLARAVEPLGVRLDPASLFDVHIKRIHEYKRQLLNVLHVVTRYNRIRRGRLEGLVPRTVVFSGKAAPGYWFAKLLIRLVHGVADVVNADPAADRWLKVVFVPNYNVSTAELIVPACDLSEQISTAGTEASGTGNMKLALNGALTIGTMDGATIEMRREVGDDNIFIFGLSADGVAERRRAGYDPWAVYAADDELREALDMIAGGGFSPGEPARFRPVFDRLTRDGDPFLVLADYASYVRCQEAVDAVFRDPHEWARRALLNVAGMGRFSSDRTVRDYARLVWNLDGVS